MIDLHIHSSASDGSDTPSELVDKAIKLGLRAIALTDHDTIDGVSEFLTHGEDKDIITIPGIEISIKDDPLLNLKDVHVVGLNINHLSKMLTDGLEKQLEGRINQKRKITRRLRTELGYEITFADVKQQAKGKTIGRPHIVKALMEKNPEILDQKSLEDLYQMISTGGVAHVVRDFEFTLEQAIQLISDAEGIPILAHLGIYEGAEHREFLNVFLKAGIKGVEVEFPYSKNRPWANSEKASWADNFFPSYFSQLADKYSLIKSGGSDYHGINKEVKLGEANVPDEYLKKILGSYS